MNRSGMEPAATASVLELDEDVDVSMPAVQQLALRTLEGGGVVLLSTSGFELTAAEGALISDSERLLVKVPEMRNGRPTIVFDPSRARIRRHYALVNGKLVRMQIRRAARPQLEAMLARFGTWAEDLTSRLFPGYTRALARDRITYRPNERAAAQSLHVDSSYGFPTQGRGMLRLFCNIDPEHRPRVWQVGEPFEVFARRFLPGVRLAGPSWTAALLARLGIVQGAKSPYDRMMAEIRRLGKRDKEYQGSAPRHIVEFPHGSCWFAITDLVLHGAVSGQHSLDQTYFLPAPAMAEPARSSLRILERLAGRPLI